MLPQQLEFVARRREEGLTWTQIGTMVSAEFQVNRLVAMRLAHGWSQRDAADEWNARWPDDIKTFKNYSYWENWPSPTGYAPSPHVLTRLAELYQCAVRDLVADHADFRHLDIIDPPAEHLEDGSDQLAFGFQCPHGCTVLAYAPN
jgi:hypothetical protein